MKKLIVINIHFFILTSVLSIGQGIWIEEVLDLNTGLRTGSIEIHGKIYEIKHIRDNADKTEDIILVGRQCNEFRQLTSQLNINIANDLTSFRLTLERLYSLIR